MLALVIWVSSFLTSVYFDLGCMTRDEYHVINSPSGTFSKISSLTPCQAILPQVVFVSGTTPVVVSEPQELLQDPSLA